MTVTPFWKTFWKILLVIAIIIAIFFVFATPFYLLIRAYLPINDSSISSYQYCELLILYVSSCVTTLALIVALLKDEIRSLWLRSKIIIKPKNLGFLNEITIGHLEKPVDIRAESYDAILSIINVGSLHIHSCLISLTQLQYSGMDGASLEDIDVSSAENINWIGKNKNSIPIHPNGGKVDVSVLQIKINDAATIDEGQSIPPKIYIGGIDATKDNSSVNKWIATFSVYFDTSKPVEYVLEINWDGKWHKRLPEMSKHTKIKEFQKR